MALELFARYVLGLGDPPLTMTHPTIEYMYKPVQNVYRFNNKILVNEYGMRSDSITLNKEDSEEVRIVVFGDSVLNGGSLTDHTALATSLLQEKLNAISDTQVKVLNVSAGSWGPGNWLAYTNEYGLFDADIVMLIISNHDIGDNPDFEPLDKVQFPRTKPTSAFVEGVSRYLPRYLPSFSKEEKKPLSEADIALSLKDLRSFIANATKQTSHFLLFHHYEKKEILSKQYKKGHPFIVDLCQQLAIVCVSMRDAFEDAMNNEQAPYRDNIHPNNTGQTIIADIMFNSLESEGLTRQYLTAQ